MISGNYTHLQTNFMLQRCSRENFAGKGKRSWMSDQVYTQNLAEAADPVYVKRRGGAINKIITKVSENCLLGSVNVWMKFGGISCHKDSQMLEGMSVSHESDGAILWRAVNVCTKWQLFHQLVRYLSRCKVSDQPTKRPISSVNFQHLSLIQPAHTHTHTQPASVASQGWIEVLNLHRAGSLAASGNFKMPL